MWTSHSPHRCEHPRRACLSHSPPALLMDPELVQAATVSPPADAPVFHHDRAVLPFVLLGLGLPLALGARSIPSPNIGVLVQLHVKTAQTQAR
jgi:hypothetical protein